MIYSGPYSITSSAVLFPSNWTEDRCCLGDGGGVRGGTNHVTNVKTLELAVAAFAKIRIE